MSWGSRRRARYLGGIALVVLVIVGWAAFSLLYEAPTCTDGEQNGTEEGVDCGGSCPRVCAFQSVEPVVLWSRSFEVTPDVYSAVALIENPNTNAQAGPTPYTLKLRDVENILVYEGNGELSLSSQRIIPFFTTGITTGERVPVRATFVFDEAPSWQRIAGVYPKIVIAETELSRVDTAPRLTVVVHNQGTESLSDIVLVAVLSDSEENARAASQTVIGDIAPDMRVPIVFTWPRPFDFSVASIEILPRFPLF